MEPVTVTRDDKGNLLLGPRTIPIPTSISPEAQKFLATPFPNNPQPEVGDKEGWKKMVAAFDALFDPMVDRLLETSSATVDKKSIAGATVYLGTPKEMRRKDWAHFTIHGGAWVFMGGRYVMGEAVSTAAEFGCTTFSLDYRMPPDYPFPTAVDEGVAVYREIIKSYDPKKVVISGASAGGNLTAAVTLKLRDAGLPLPGAIGMMTPAVDMTRASDTMHTNDGIDTVLRPGGRAVALYADGHDLTDPYLSPLYGDFTKGFPPTFLQSGTRDLLLSDTVRMHRKLLQAGIEAELHVWEAMPHGGFGGVFGSPTPEDREMRDQFMKFVEKHLG